MTENTPFGTANFIFFKIRNNWRGPPEQLIPITSAPALAMLIATFSGVSPRSVLSSLVKVIEAIIGIS